MAARPRPSYLRPLACLATAALAACAPAQAKGPDAAVPPDLLLTVALGPASTLRGLQAYAEAVKPGVGALISDQVVRRQLAVAASVPSIDGLDSTGWTYAMVSDTGGTMAVTLAGKVRDAKALTAAAGADHLTIKNGWAVIGDRLNVDRYAPFAFATLATQATPKLPTATIYLPQLLAHYQPQLSAMRAQMTAMNQSTAMKAAMTGYIDGLGSIGDDTDKLIVTLDAAPDLASLDFAFVPKARSRLATFAALQKPSDYALLAKLPAQDSALLMAGHVELGPYHDGMMAVMAALLDPSGSKDLLAAMELVRKAMTGDIAASAQMIPGAGMQMTQVFGTTDKQAAEKGLWASLDLFKAGRTVELDGAKMTIQTSATPTTYDGVTLRGYSTTMDLSKATELQRQTSTMMGSDKPQHALVGVFDKVAMVVLSKDTLADAQKTIDAARGKGTPYAPPAPLKAQLDASRGRKDSVAMIFDIGKFAAAFAPGASLGIQPFVMSLGTADRNAHLRFALPAATLHGLASLKPPARP